MFSEFLQKRKDLLVSLVLPLLLALGAAGLFAPSAAADTLTGLTVEQARADMPQVRLYVYDEAGSLAAAPEAYLDGSPLTYTGTESCDAQGTSYIVMLDVSGSIRKGYFEAAKQQVLALGDALGQKDSVTLITFGDEVKLQAAGCRSRAELEPVLAELTARDQRTRLYEAVEKGLDYAATTGSRQRQVMLIVSDGIQDTDSVGVSRQEITDRLEQASMPVYSFCVDYADRAAQEEFGQFARTTGGEFEVFSASSAAAVWDGWQTRLKQAKALTFTAATNHVDGSTHTLLLKVGDENYTRTLALVDWAADNTPPELVSAVYDQKTNTLTVGFSESVLGAEDPAAYQLQKKNKTLAPLSVTAQEDGSYQLQLPRLTPGSWTLSCTGIRDDSMEQNPLADGSFTFKRSLTFMDLVPFIAAAAAVVVLVLVVVLLLIRKKPRTQTVQVPVPVPAPPQEVHHDYNYQVQHLDIAPGMEVHGAGAAPEAKVRFEITTGPQKGQSFEVQITKSAIWGRSREMCDICLDDHRISRQHCVLETAEGGVRITDLGSQNGTYLNGIRIQQPRLLTKGDTVQLGNTVLRVAAILL